MLKNIRVAYRILIAFLIVFLIFLFSVLYNVFAVNKISTTLDNFYNHPYTVSNKVKEIAIKSNEIHEYLNEIYNLSDNNKIFQNQILMSQIENEILDDLRIIEVRFLGDSEKIDTLRESFINSISIHQDIINSILDGDYEQAQLIRDIQGKDNEKKMTQTIEEMLLVADHYASSFMDEANSIHKDQQNMVLNIGIFSVVAMLILAFFLSKGISKPLKELVRVIESSDKIGDSINLDITRKDEIGQVNESYKEMIEKIQMREKQLRRSNRELESFSYSVSHDLRAPLRHMTGYINLMKKKHGEALPQEAKRYLNIVQGASEKMDLLINSLLEYSRTGRKELRKERIDFDEIVNKIVDDLSADNENRKIDWSINSLGIGYADHSLITTVWENLIGNAYKYTSKEENAVIEIGKYQEGEDDVFYVKDNGIGFDMEYYDKIFSVFQRLNGEEDFKGVGIGLANVQRIISMHEGEVWAKAVLGEGATFYFKLRRQKNDKDA